VGKDSVIEVALSSPPTAIPTVSEAADREREDPPLKLVPCRANVEEEEATVMPPPAGVSMEGRGESGEEEESHSCDGASALKNPPVLRRLL